MQPQAVSGPSLLGQFGAWAGKGMQRGTQHGLRLDSVDRRSCLGSGVTPHPGVSYQHCPLPAGCLIAQLKAPSSVTQTRRPVQCL